MFFLLIPVVLYMLIKKYFFSKSPKKLLKKHVVVTGGSSGIGKSVGILAASRGANVTIIARDEDKLKLAERDIKKACIDENQQVKIFSLDVTDNVAVTRVFDQIEDSGGPIYMLINCAGKSICRTLEDMSVDDITSMLNLNVLGTVFPTRWVLPKFKARKEGIIVITASQASLIGIYGMSVYSASKFALRGFAEAIDMEARFHNVSVTLSLPPDTDTPGLHAENIGKPEETLLISGCAGLFQPDVVAERLLDDALDKKFFSHIGFESFVSTTLGAGMSPCSSIAEILLQLFCMGPLRLIGLGYLAHFHRIIRRGVEKSEKQK
ncbi:hypothetical protein PPYR_10079 [Photinus pyralis]|uniref:3-dehydrosphinganine reductase n=1 Tax=Photinus pyralis TaxID=7054 RepID=A0A5N4AFL1_PHOPY|nr:3-ketodihydrosphingosine reductase [Photinus pyralis]KAB0796018.1 hypothetical protein PPYR_10079 [Photinus pyralis]